MSANPGSRQPIERMFRGRPSIHSPIAIAAIVVLSIALMLIRPRGIAEVWWAGGGASLLVFLRLVPASLAARAVGKGSDVYLFLIGMMLLSELAREQGVFDWLASAAVREARGSPGRLFVLVYGIGTLVTVFLSNDATAVVLTPAILAATRKAKVAPLPYLFACAMIANAASFVLPISNPANLVVFRGDMPSLGRWLLSYAVPSLLAIVATYAVLRLVFRRDLQAGISQTPEPVDLSANGRLVLGGLALTVAVLLTTSACHVDLGLPTCAAAVVIVAVACRRAKANPLSLAREISWRTLALVAGLFVLVDAVESIGALRYATAWLTSAANYGTAGAILTALAVGIGNNVVNNLPLGLIASGTLQAAQAQGLIAQAVLIGVDLGPNLSVTGSLATILWLLALRKEKLEVSFGDFLKVGAIAMPVALLAAMGGAILMRRILGVA